MEYVQLNNGVMMPRVGFGTWDIRGQEGKKILDQAIEIGYRLFDTAQMYDNEEIVGQAIHDSNIPRNEFFITTKLSHRCKSKEETIQSFEESLNRLGLEYVDLLLIHEPYNESIIMYQALEDIYKQGKAKAIGISNFSYTQVQELLNKTTIRPALIQIESHVYDPQLDYLYKLQQLNVQMQAWAPFTEGRKDIFHEKVLMEIASKHNKTSAQIALKYLLQNNIHVISKTSKVERMKENIDILDFNLDLEDINKIKTLDEKKSLFGWYGNYWM